MPKRGGVRGKAQNAGAGLFFQNRLAVFVEAARRAASRPAVVVVVGFVVVTPPTFIPKVLVIQGHVRVRYVLRRQRIDMMNYSAEPDPTDLTQSAVYCPPIRYIRIAARGPHGAVIKRFRKVFHEAHPSNPLASPFRRPHFPLWTLYHTLTWRSAILQTLQDLGKKTVAAPEEIAL